MEAIWEDLYVLSDELPRLGRIHPWSCLGNLKLGSGREQSFLFIKLCRFDPGEVSVLRLPVPASPPAQICQFTFIGRLMGCYILIGEQSARWQVDAVHPQGTQAAHTGPHTGREYCRHTR